MSRGLRFSNTAEAQETHTGTMSMSQSESRFGAGSVVLLLLMALGLGIAVVRYATGLGAVTNLNDAWPWGLWIGFDVLCGVALAAGGFCIAAAVYIFRLGKYHSIVRPAVLTAFLGYLLVIIALLMDLGQYYKVWHPLVFWQHGSAMFEVGWCVFLYTIVLALEFVPVVFERFSMGSAERQVRKWTPIFIIAVLTLFAFAMTHSVLWTLLVAAVAIVFQVLVWMDILPRDTKTPILLVTAGVIFSTLHQSSLGSLFLIVPHKLHALWYTPLLPLLFLVSAVAVGLAMVIFESTLSSKVFKRGLELKILSGIGRFIPYVLGLYLLLKMADLVGSGDITHLLALSKYSVLFWAEIMIGVLLPILLLITPEVSSRASGLFWASLCVIVGVVMNRLSISMAALDPGSALGYFPSWMEFAVTVAIVAAGILAFSLAARHLPIYESGDLSEMATADD